jgi:glutathione S-transferase
MPVIETSNQKVKNYVGLHLYHFWLSSCSQRVRVVLAEKELNWVAHPVDISPIGLEHSSEEYQSIHPKGLVPALVHNGQVVVESIDIIDYLDNKFPEPRLSLTSGKGQNEMHIWMDRADAAQHSIKTLTHEFLFKSDRMNPEQLVRFKDHHKNKELCDFMEVFCSDEGFPKSEIESELKLQHDEFSNLDQALQNQQWLVENSFSLADIAWIPNVRRLDIMGYPLERHSNLFAWYERFQKRQSYQKGIEGYEIIPVLDHFRAYCEQREKEGTGIKSFKPLIKSNKHL